MTNQKSKTVEEAILEVIREEYKEFDLFGNVQLRVIGITEAENVLVERLAKLFTSQVQEACGELVEALEPFDHQHKGSVLTTTCVENIIRPCEHDKAHDALAKHREKWGNNE